MNKLSICLILATKFLFAEGLITIGPSAKDHTTIEEFKAARKILIDCEAFKKKYPEADLLSVDWFIQIKKTDEYCGRYDYDFKDNVHRITVASVFETDPTCYYGDYNAIFIHEMLHKVIGGHPRPIKSDSMLDFVLDPVEQMVYLCYEKPYKGRIYLLEELQEFEQLEKNGAL